MAKLLALPCRLSLGVRVGATPPRVPVKVSELSVVVNVSVPVVSAVGVGVGAGEGVGTGGPSMIVPPMVAGSWPEATAVP